MKKYFLMLMVFTPLMLFSQNRQSDLSFTELLQKTVQTQLSAKGCSYEYVSEDILYFERGNIAFCFITDKEDINYVRIVIATHCDKNIRNKVLEALNKISSDTKMLKAYLLEEDDEGIPVRLAIEYFVYSTSELKDDFERYLNILSFGYTRLLVELL